MHEPNVFPRFVRAPRAAPEAVGGDRHDLYVWLAQKLIDSRQVRVERQTNSIYVTTEQMKTEPSAIWRLLELPPDLAGRPTLAIIDLSTNPYHLLRDIFLHHVADLSRSWLQGSATRKVLILLPLLPPLSSIFWSPIMSGRDLDRQLRLVVLGNDGSSWPTELGKASLLEYSRHQSRSASDLKEMLEARIVRKVGHYDLGPTEDPYCADYFFETDAAEHEIGELVRQWAEERIRPRVQGGDFTLISHGNQSERFHAAVAGAAAAMNCRFVAMSGNYPLTDEDRVEGEGALVLNVVHTGRTYSAVVESLRLQGLRLAPEALTVMTTDPHLQLSNDLPALHSLCHRNRNKISRMECQQCEIGLPPADPKNEEAQIGIRAIDMWRMLLRCQWNEEKFGPRGKRPFFGYMPDMGDVFKNYGDWIAFKVAELFRGLGVHQDVVLVCPEEPRIERLIARLGVLMQNRQVAVQIPRAVLNSKDLDRALRDTADNAWHRQLRHLGRRGYDNVVMIDEFVISYSTARSTVRLLQRSEFGIEPRAYIPIIDFSVGGGMASPPTYPLYRLPHPGGRR